MTGPVAPAIGDTTFLASYLINTRVYGVVVPGNDQQEFMATYEIQGDQGTLTMAVAIGPRGPAGADMFLLTMQSDAVEDVADLPQTLTNTTADIGKFWLFDDVDANGDIIGSSAYIWYGKTFRRVMFGETGPPGPVPIITPYVNLTGYPGTSKILTGGTPYEPTFTFDLAIPPGPQGPGAALSVAPDVSSTPPQPGDLLGFTGTYTTGHLAAPSTLTLVVSGSGGSWTPGTYYWVITAYNSSGETTASNEVFATVSAGQSIILNWESPPGQGGFGATGYNIYRGTATQAENILVRTLTSVNTTSFTDTGLVGTSGSPPSSSTATVQYPVWGPVSVSQLLPQTYSMPEGAFTAYTGISTQAPIGSLVIPPQPFPWTPIVWGHIGAFGVELSANPLLIGCEVLLGNPTGGQVVARGFGNTLGEVNIMPHYSNPNNPSLAMTPTNALAVCPANHSNPAEGTIYVNLYNDGEIGLYLFSPTDAQLFVMLVPVIEPGGTPIFAATAPFATPLTGGAATITFQTPSGDAPFTYSVLQQASLIPPAPVTVGTAGSGGTFAAATYYWVVTAADINGESTRSAEVSAAVTASGQATITWGAVAGSTGYKVYRGTTTGTENVLIATTPGTTLSYVDTGSSGTPATPPLHDTSASPFAASSLVSATGTVSGTNTTLQIQGGTLLAGVGYAFQVTAESINGASSTSETSNIIEAQGGPQSARAVLPGHGSLRATAQSTTVAARPALHGTGTLSAAVHMYSIHRTAAFTGHGALTATAVI